MEASLTLLYTQRIRGDLALLPRLYTFLRQLRGEHGAGGQTLLLDLGESCAPEVFPCALTGGRSTLIALDAMGYHAANVCGWLTASDRERLEAAHLQTAQVDDAHPLVNDALVLFTGQRVPILPEREAALAVALDPAEATQLDVAALRLGAVESGQVGMARLVWREGQPSLVAQGVYALPLDTLPDATIAGTVEFILSEARYTQKRREAKSGE
jgi:hypothetical protein